jgi:hypothetical protein
MRQAAVQRMIIIDLNFGVPYFTGKLLIDVWRTLSRHPTARGRRA